MCFGSQSNPAARSPLIRLKYISVVKIHNKHFPFRLLISFYKLCRRDFRFALSPTTNRLRLTSSRVSNFCVSSFPLELANQRCGLNRDNEDKPHQLHIAWQFVRMFGENASVNNEAKLRVT